MVHYQTSPNARRGFHPRVQHQNTIIRYVLYTFDGDVVLIFNSRELNSAVLLHAPQKGLKNTRRCLRAFRRGTRYNVM